MKHKTDISQQHLRNRLSILLAFAGVSVIGSVFGEQEDLSAWKVTDYEMTINGTSTMHDWESQVTKVQATGKLDLENGELQAVSELAVDNAVTGIVSPYDLMDRLTYKALKESDHPTIQYRLTKLSRLEGDRWQSTGDLTIAGDTKPWDMEVEVTADDSKALFVSGTTSLEMTHFGVKPPRLMFGAIKVGDAIRIDFSVTLEPTANQPQNNETQMD